MLKIRRASRGALFVGAGDSYAAALAGFFASGGRCIALDPYSLATSPEVAAGMEVYFISVSGKTASNVAAAKKVKGISSRTVALTAVEGSPLARIVDRVQPLRMEYAPRKAGILSFSLSLLAVLRLAGRDEKTDFGKALRNARRDRGSLVIGRGTTYLLGNSAGYASALYAAAKAYEVLGVKAHAELLEEFSHMEVFSLARGDQVDAFSCFDPLGRAEKLAATLAKSGCSASLVPSRGSNFVERLFHSVFVGQLSILETASRAGLREPRFLNSRGRLRASDSMIY
jgi:glucosamine 6-phosphate synthetase-like amidotransferase/phosphosugar isomerase protein